MSPQPAITIASHRFAFGFYRQIWWNWLIGSAFFFGEIGAGLFLVSLLTHEGVGLIVGYLMVVVGKNTAHLLYLGRPARFWRAAMRPDRSWIARGIWATGIFTLTGLVLVVTELSGQDWPSSDLGGAVVLALAALSALFIMFYDGLVMNVSPAIPFWHTKLLPLLCLTYAALGGTTLSLTLREWLGTNNRSAMLLMRIEYLLLVINLLLLGIYLLRMSRGTLAARETVRLLLKGPYTRAFIGLVLLVGLIATLMLSIVHSQVHATWLVILIATCELTGDFTLLMVLLKSGLFSPLTAPAYRD